MKFAFTSTLVTLIIVSLVLSGCTNEVSNIDKISNFDECVNAGNLVMESYPRQCRANGQTFVEDISENKESHVCTTEEKESLICTKEYDPVCGSVDNNIRCITEPCQNTDVKTFSNGCSACSNGAIDYYKGSCDSLKFIICKETVTGFDPKEFAKDSGAICVDICPGNYDSYTTQVGFEMCIVSYDKTTIDSWESCQKSSSDCECVKAYETTQNEPIDNSEYKCVPSEYANRLLFRSGLDRLNENGEQSVMIA